MDAPDYVLNSLGFLKGGKMKQAEVQSFSHQLASGMQERIMQEQLGMSVPPMTVTDVSASLLRNNPYKQQAQGKSGIANGLSAADTSRQVSNSSR